MYDKQTVLEQLRFVKRSLEEFYPLMDMTDFENAIYCLEDDIEEDDDL